VRIAQVDGLAGAAGATGVAVIIDVLRAFTVSAYALAGGAAECRLVTTLEEGLALQRQIPGSLVSAEIDGLPVPGVPISNSPAQLADHDLSGRVLIQRSSDGTLGVAAAGAADAVYACSLVVARATAEILRSLGPPLVTLVAMGTPRGHGEDSLCSRYLHGMLTGRPFDMTAERKAWRRSERGRLLAAGGGPGFPREDVELAFAVDRFDFAMPLERTPGSLRLRPEPAQASR
jgi:2-phosphosulfolactate phosphatase